MHFLLGVHFYLQNCHLLCELFSCVYFYLYILFGIIIIYVVENLRLYCRKKLAWHCLYGKNNSAIFQLYKI